MPYVRKPFVTPTSRAVTRIQSSVRGRQARVRHERVLARKQAAEEAPRAERAAQAAAVARDRGAAA